MRSHHERWDGQRLSGRRRRRRHSARGARVRGRRLARRDDERPPVPARDAVDEWRATRSSSRPGSSSTPTSSTLSATAKRAARSAARIRRGCLRTRRCQAPLRKLATSPEAFGFGVERQTCWPTGVGRICQRTICRHDEQRGRFHARRVAADASGAGRARTSRRAVSMHRDPMMCRRRAATSLKATASARVLSTHVDAGLDDAGVVGEEPRPLRRCRSR